MAMSHSPLAETLLVGFWVRVHHRFNTAAPSFCPTNLADASSATPPSTVMAIMPTRSFPPGAISVDVCPNAAPDNPASNAAIDRRSLPTMCISPERNKRCATLPAVDWDCIGTDVRFGSKAEPDSPEMRLPLCPQDRTSPTRPAMWVFVERGRQLRRPYFYSGGRSPGDRSHSLMCDPVSACPPATAPPSPLPGPISTAPGSRSSLTGPRCVFDVVEAAVFSSTTLNHPLLSKQVLSHEEA